MRSNSRSAVKSPAATRPRPRSPRRASASRRTAGASAASLEPAGHACCAAACRSRRPVAEVLVLVAFAVSVGCGALRSLPVGVLALGGLAAALAIAGVDIVPLLLVTVAPWTAGRIVRSRQQLIAALGERNRQLEAEQDALAELAVRRERARIARELHDIVAHHLAVMAIQAGAGRLGAPDGAARFAGIRDAGREALR